MRSKNLSGITWLKMSSFFMCRPFVRDGNPSSLSYNYSMVLIGMLDSPYVRRCAVSMKLMGIAFEHRPVSVFRHFEQFRAINPVVKAPTLVCDDGTVLMDSTLILDYLETGVEPARRLLSG